MTVPTTSEKLFEAYCAASSIAFEPIETEDEEQERRPDYRLVLAGRVVIAEVKQIDPNQAERDQMGQLEDQGHCGSLGGAPGKRAYGKIKDAADQLRQIAKGLHPTLVVLFNNVPICPQHLHPYAIKTAMLGLETLDIAVPLDPNLPLSVTERRFGRRRSLTRTDNTTVSAVAVLTDLPSSTPHLDIYHNPYATLPIEPDWLRNESCRHFRLTEKEPTAFQFSGVATGVDP